MIRTFKWAATMGVAALALGGCQLDSPKTAAPAKRPPAADYQAAAPALPPPANIRAICFNDEDLAIMRGRMLQMELSVATLQCQGPGGTRAFEGIYTRFLEKFRPELTTNMRSLTQVAGRKRLNVDVVVTEFSNRMAQQAPTDKDFCPRSLRALEWAMDPKVAKLADAPPPYDLGPQMNIFPCPPK
ncbi:MAG: hypothetical protein JOY81_14050 [Alphaproteobacteria bacterium]|nr:hypothetical protein [Alphaproteobacteria bacterium]